jgi:hypothetical protein
LGVHPIAPLKKEERGIGKRNKEQGKEGQRGEGRDKSGNKGKGWELAGKDRQGAGPGYRVPCYRILSMHLMQVNPLLT